MGGARRNMYQDRTTTHDGTVLRSTVDGSTERWRFLVGVGLDWIRFRRSLRRRRRGNVCGACALVSRLLSCISPSPALPRGGRCCWLRFGAIEHPRDSRFAMNMSMHADDEVKLTDV